MVVPETLGATTIRLGPVPRANWMFVSTLRVLMSMAATACESHRLTNNTLPSGLHREPVRKLADADLCDLLEIARADDSHEIVDAVGHPQLGLVLHELKRVRIGVEVRLRHSVGKLSSSTRLSPYAFWIDDDEADQVGERRVEDLAVVSGLERPDAVARRDLME